MASNFSHIPDKVYFRIGEVSELVGVETHVLRYWESEFALIKPFRGKSKQRLYRRKDVQTLLVIKDLLHQQGYTISGARKYLKQALKTGTLEQTSQPKQGADSEAKADIIQQVKSELRALLTQLEQGNKPKN
ncbi:MerR family transcriptional regulator [Desulfobulbus rhabdoformis]|jgi:DNA-binding transcriptional MerR regulator|uniref:MerR family transcriptional regulator n=1 Tax=Desulfobulbus rhabdoformis TaxID=34032 RepID=UPI001963EE86|nr:MerR family transcriptional regulator [Desulfobulbus rhabdoformis]MBM9614898.1 MerR family transcriptional regulator [Desulfobulbus rhabdoformis]